MAKWLLMIVIVAAGFSACETVYDGSPGVGGALPSNYIAIKDSGFSPMILSVVNGSTITFVNNTTTSKTILSTDSTIIPVTVVPAGGSYLFKKDTTASFQYYQKGKPAITGVINLTP